MRGQICSVNEQRGFGFIKPDEGGPDIFFHVHDLPPDSGIVFASNLVGSAVTFNVGQSPKGPRAIDVRRA